MQGHSKMPDDVQSEYSAVFAYITTFQTTNQFLQLKSKSHIWNLLWFSVIIAKDAEDILAKKYIFYFLSRNEQAEINFHVPHKMLGPLLSSGRCSVTHHFLWKTSTFTHKRFYATFRWTFHVENTIKLTFCKKPHIGNAKFFL